MKICIDAGHGMSNKKGGVYDSGASAGGFNEADITLQWALTGKFILQQHVFDVFLTRDDDRDEDPVGLRDDKAKAAGCDVLISIHCNSGGGTGVETFYRDAGDLPLARMVNNAAIGATGLRNRGTKVDTESQHKEGLAIMAFKPPCCLCEVGFIDTAKDRKRITDRAVRIEFWKAVAAGLKQMGGGK